MIRYAHAGDLPAIEESYELLFAHEAAHGNFSGWRKGIYPAPSMLDEALAEGHLLVLRGEKDEFLASMVLGSEVPRGITDPMWRFPADPDEILSIDALLVTPDERGKGHGKRMLSFVLDQAVRNGKAVVRLATYERNEPMLGLCGKLDFERCSSSIVMLGGLIPQRQVFLERVVGR